LCLATVSVRDSSAKGPPRTKPARRRVRPRRVRSAATVREKASKRDPSMGASSRGRRAARRTTPEQQGAHHYTPVYKRCLVAQRARGPHTAARCTQPTRGRESELTV